MSCHLPSSCLVAGIAIALAVNVGCQSLNTEIACLFGEAPESTAETAASDPDGPKYFVEFREEGRKPVLVQRPLNDLLYVQQALEQTGALKKFRRMKIEVYRQLPQGGGHKIPVTFDRSERRVTPGSDYALHANDRVVVTEDKSTVLDDMLEAFNTPITRSAEK